MLGARRNDILLQFLIESSTIAVIGGVIGVLCGIIAAKLVSIATPLPAAVQFWSVLSGLIVALSVGTLFVTLPTFVIRAQAEEQLLREQFGAAYDRYAEEVPMLVPGPRGAGRPGRRTASMISRWFQAP